MIPPATEVPPSPAPKAMRDTRQRNAIKRAFAEMKRPLGPREVLAIASKSVPNLGIATVYRNIKTLVEEKELVTIDLPGQPPRYSLPEDRTPHLFICRETDRVFFLPEGAVQVELKNLPRGFKPERTEVVVFGRAPAK